MPTLCNALRVTRCPHLKEVVVVLCAAQVLAVASAQVQLNIDATPLPLISVAGPNGQVEEIQWSDSLSDPGHWFYLTNRMLAGTVQVLDPNPPSVGPRFYRAVRVPDENMVLVPGGSFAMGDTFAEGYADELPVHNTSVSAFYMARTELTGVQWGNTYVYAITHGYDFDNDGSSKGPLQPVHTVSWYDAVKWCNARSEEAGLTPVYYTSAEQTNVYRTGRIDLSNYSVCWSADGYRLPTEAEWERAARSGAGGVRFPWGNVITFSNANYQSFGNLSYDQSGTNGYNPAYAVGDYPYTSPVGSFPANAYGLFDLTGNVWEWCWDRFNPSWYANPGAGRLDTPGPAGPDNKRVKRGGSWDVDASFGRCASRFTLLFQEPESADFTIGFRCVMALPGFVSPAVIGQEAALPGGRFRFTLYNLAPGKTNVIEVSTNLAAWTAIATNVPATATLAFTNVPGTGVGVRFYRSRQLH